MVGIKLLLLSSLFFFQGIRGYCIHNKFSDGSTFRITQHPGIKEEPSQSYFTRHMKKDTTECCPYTSKFCSPSLSDGNGAKFGFKIFFIDRSSYVGTKNIMLSARMPKELLLRLRFSILSKRKPKKKIFVSIT
ncbi:hypothetical protein EDC94DRAFT_584124 [Helicostylum pulchrum]|nr:hypothetical protein EDC94DRAFT_584124 [Helicostylum pulchrum]